jgi:hypothetical protein
MIGGILKEFDLLEDVGVENVRKNFINNNAENGGCERMSFDGVLVALFLLGKEIIICHKENVSIYSENKRRTQ